MSASTMNLINPTTGRLTAATVERLHTLLGGDPVTEEMMLTFIAGQYGAKNLFYVSAHVTAQILQRPADFIRAAKQHCEPELKF